VPSTEQYEDYTIQNEMGWTYCMHDKDDQFVHNFWWVRKPGKEGNSWYTWYVVGRRRQNNVREISLMKWSHSIQLAKGSVRWRNLVTIVINLPVPQTLEVLTVG
jgi:hypothetical protein